MLKTLATIAALVASPLAAKETYGAWTSGLQDGSQGLICYMATLDRPVVFDISQLEHSDNPDVFMYSKTPITADVGSVITISLLTGGETRRYKAIVGTPVLVKLIDFPVLDVAAFANGENVTLLSNSGVPLLTWTAEGFGEAYEDFEQCSRRLKGQPT